MARGRSTKNILDMMRWIRTSWSSIKNSLSRPSRERQTPPGPGCRVQGSGLKGQHIHSLTLRVYRCHGWQYRRDRGGVLRIRKRTFGLSAPEHLFPAARLCGSGGNRPIDLVSLNSRPKGVPQKALRGGIPVPFLKPLPRFCQHLARIAHVS